MVGIRENYKILYNTMNTTEDTFIFQVSAWLLASSQIVQIIPYPEKICTYISESPKLPIKDIWR